MSRHELEPPGAGLPAFENFYLNAIFKIGTALMSDQRAMGLFETVSNEIIDMIQPVDIGRLAEQTLIPRIQGIEDSSRSWSVLMVLAHLNQVNSEIISIIRALHSGRAPQFEVNTADFKPNDEDVDAGVIDEFLQVNFRYKNFVTSHIPLRTNLQHVHPWFGFLDGHSWHCLAAVHQRIHRRQIQKILSMQGMV